MRPPPWSVYVRMIGRQHNLAGCRTRDEMGAVTDSRTVGRGALQHIPCGKLVPSRAGGSVTRAPADLLWFAEVLFGLGGRAALLALETSRFRTVFVLALPAGHCSPLRVVFDCARLRFTCTNGPSHVLRWLRPRTPYGIGLRNDVFGLQLMQYGGEYVPGRC